MEYKNITKPELIKAYESNLKLIDELQEANMNLSKRCVKLDKENEELKDKFKKLIEITSGYKKLVNELSESNDELIKVNKELQVCLAKEIIKNNKDTETLIGVVETFC